MEWVVQVCAVPCFSANNVFLVTGLKQVTRTVVFLGQAIKLNQKQNWLPPKPWPTMIAQTLTPLYGGTSRREKDVVTPHSISIILFIEKYARLRPKYWDPRPQGKLMLY